MRKTINSKTISILTFRLIIFLYVIFASTACSKTEDYLRDMVVKQSNLVDPNSAIFRNIVEMRNMNEGHTYCGDINAKNSMGGYIGWVPFIIKVDVNIHSTDVTIQERRTIPFDASPKQIELIATEKESDTEFYNLSCFNAQQASSYIWKLL